MALLGYDKCFTPVTYKNVRLAADERQVLGLDGCREGARHMVLPAETFFVHERPRQADYGANAQ